MFMPTHHDQHRRIFKPNPLLIMFVLVESVFWALGATCLLAAMHRIASALKLGARVKALHTLGDAYTEEERALLIRKIKARTLSRL